MILSLVMALSLQGDVSDQWVARTTRPARVVATCRDGADCDRKRERARSWIAQNSRFTLARDTPDLLITNGAIYADTHPSIAVLFDPPRDGIRQIRFRAWCGNIFACFPSPGSLRRLFAQAMADVP